MAVKCILTGQEKVNLSGDTMTGDLKVGSSSIGTNGYIEGTWLKITKATESAGDFATISGDGWIYKRKPADVLGDIGAQPKITVNGFLKGDGTGVITADKPVFQVTITENTSDNSYSADKTYSKIIEAYNNGYTVQAVYNVDSANKEIYSLMSTYRSGSVKMLYFVYLNDHEEKRFTCRVTAAAEKWLYKESSLVPSNLTINNKPLSSNITLTPSDIGAQPKTTADGILKGDGTGNITAADETEVELVDLPIQAEAITIPKGRMRGDVDGDGKITEDDSIQVTKHVASIEILTGIDLWCADADGNGSVTSNDVQNIYRCANSLSSVLTSIPTFADYYNNWTYVKVNDLTSYWTAEIPIAGLTTSNNVVINICEIFPMGQFYKAEVLEGKVKIYANRPPINDIPAIVVISLGSGKGSIPSCLNDSSLEYKGLLVLPTASWTGSDPYAQTVTISGSTADTKVDIQPSEELYDQLIADNVGYLAIKNVDGTLTAVAKGGKPSVDLTVQVTYNNVY